MEKLFKSLTSSFHLHRRLPAGLTGAWLIMAVAFAQSPAHQLHRAENGESVTLRFALSELPGVAEATDILIPGATVHGVTLLPLQDEAQLHVSGPPDSTVGGSSITAVLNGESTEVETGPYEIVWFEAAQDGSLARRETRTVHRTPEVHAFLVLNQGEEGVLIRRMLYGAAPAITGAVLVTATGPGIVLDDVLPDPSDAADPYDAESWSGQPYSRAQASSLDILLAPGDRVGLVISGEAFVDADTFTLSRMWDFAPWIEYEEAGQLRRLLLPSSSRNLPER